MCALRFFSVYYRLWRCDANRYQARLNLNHSGPGSGKGLRLRSCRCRSINNEKSVWYVI